MRVPIDVRWRDLDPLGHVNNSVAVGYLEHARLEAWRRAMGPVEARALPLVVARVEVDYRHPIHLEDPVEVEIVLGEIGRSSFRYSYRVFAGDRVAAEATSVQVHVGPDGRPRPLPEAVKEALRRAVD